MKARAYVVAILILMALKVQAESKAVTNRGFERMKTLVGAWRGNVPPYGEVRATYTLHSGGSALLESLVMPGEESMISVYYASGNAVEMTHYCSISNQPFMRGVLDGNAITFKTVRVSNLGGKDAEYMSGVRFRFRDADHFTATWTSTAKGKSGSNDFHFTREK